VFSHDPAHPSRFHCATLQVSLLGATNWDYYDLGDATLLGLPSDLSGLSAVHTDLTNIVLPGVKLNRAKLDSATLQGANLAGADLSFASMRGAVLSADPDNGILAAKLTGATLLDTDLSNAQLGGVDL